MASLLAGDAGRGVVLGSLPQFGADNPGQGGWGKIPVLSDAIRLAML
jgi:hypothetical protein